MPDLPSATPSLDMAAIRADVPAAGRQTFLNSAGSSLMPRPVVQVMHDYLYLEAEVGGYAAQQQQAEALAHVYQAAADLICARPTEIALMQSATAAWQMAFYSLALGAGDVVLTCEAEYAANVVAMLQLRERLGIRFEVVPSDPDSGELDLQALARMLRPEVKLIAMTWVPTNGGLVNPAAEVGALARAHGVPYLLDACQAVGQLPVDVNGLGCDMLCATGRKFLRGPRGTGFLFVRQDFMDRLVPHTIDHFSAEWTDAQRYTLRDDARRYEIWETNCVGQVGLGAALDYALGLDMHAIASRNASLAAQAREGLSGIAGVTVRDLGRSPCAIVTFTVQDMPAADVVSRAREAGIAMGVSSPPSTRLDAMRRQLPDLVRASPHYFNLPEEIETLVRVVHALRRSR